MVKKNKQNLKLFDWRYKRWELTCSYANLTTKSWKLLIFKVSVINVIKHSKDSSKEKSKNNN